MITNSKLITASIPNNFLHINEYNNMQVLLKNIYDCMQDDATLWLKFNSLDYKEVLKLVEEAGFTNHLDNWMITEDEEGNRQDYFHLTKKSSGYVWNKVEYKREVVVPYMVDGKPRGWFRGPDGRPVRFTGIGNCCYASKILGQYNFSDLIFILTSSNRGDEVDLQNLEAKDLAIATGRKVKGCSNLSINEDLKNAIVEIVGEV